MSKRSSWTWRRRTWSTGRRPSRVKLIRFSIQRVFFLCNVSFVFVWGLGVFEKSGCFYHNFIFVLFIFSLSGIGSKYIWKGQSCCTYVHGYRREMESIGIVCMCVFRDLENIFSDVGDFIWRPGQFLLGGRWGGIVIALDTGHHLFGRFVNYHFQYDPHDNRHCGIDLVWSGY